MILFGSEYSFININRVINKVFKLSSQSFSKTLTFTLWVKAERPLSLWRGEPYLLRDERGLNVNPASSQSDCKHLEYMNINAPH